jgi:hypothetical protein
MSNANSLVDTTRVGATPYLCWLYLQARRSQDPDELRTLSFSDVEQIRRAIANNAKAPADVIEELSRDWCSSVRSAAALNPGAGFRVLSRLVEDSDDDVRLAAARALTNHSRLLHKLAQDGNPRIRAVAKSALEKPAAPQSHSSNVAFAPFGRAA